ncbi:MAG: hypothetical protein Q7J05_04615 [Paludibacter sp.]|nr:hypothetical protein [Paludibacter sp.]
MKMKFFTSIALVLLMLIAVSCEEPVVPPETITYDLEVRSLLGVNGTVTFTETSSTSVTVEINITGAPAGTHPAEICSNSAVEGGPTLVVLTPVNSAGKSTTLTSSITYQQIIALDGFVQVYLNGELPKEVIAIGDIGGNVLTTTSISYPMSTAGSYGITGTALFQKRTNGHTLVTLNMNGLLSNAFYPATINVGSIGTIGGGGVKKVLNDVDGNTGKSFTNIRKLNNEVPITYDNWLVYVGYINVYHTEIDNANIISQGNIGAN